MTRPSIRRLTDNADFDEIVALLSRAFWVDPLFDYLSRDLLSEYQVLPHVFRSAMTDLRSELADLHVAEIAGRPRSFAGWLGPGAFPRPRMARIMRDLRAAILLVRLQHRRSAAALLQEVERRHPTELHWYLALLGTDPAVQGEGLGRAVIAPVLDRCDVDGCPAYTETQKLENVAWYGRSGFAVMDQVEVRDAPPIWRLWRDPR